MDNNLYKYKENKVLNKNFIFKTNKFSNIASKEYYLSTAIYYALRCTFELKIQA